MEEIEKAAFQFFWEQTDPNSGQVKDRALAAGNDTHTVSSIAATGFGLAALCIGDQRGYQPHATILSRVQSTLGFLATTMQPLGQNGFFYHYVDMTTGARAFTSEVSSIDTAILLCGVLTCRAYFSDKTVHNLATQIYTNVNFNWMLAAWTRPTIQYHGLTYISGSDSLLVHQYSHAWFDFRNKKDSFANYFQNSVTATQAHRLFCISLASQFSDYSPNLWGVTSSDSSSGYAAWGGPSPQGGPIGPVDGSIVPQQRDPWRLISQTRLKCCAGFADTTRRPGGVTVMWMPSIR